MDRRWVEYHVFPSKTFLSRSAEKFRGGTLQGFWKLRISKSFMQKEAISLLSVEKFLSRIAEKLRRGTHPGFRKILVSKVINKVEKSR